MKIDVHQHLWTQPLIEALSARTELPFVRVENGLTVLFIRGERPYVIDLAGEAPEHRAALVQEDGVDRALLCLSSPLGIEWLRREQAQPLIDAYHHGALAAGEPFGVWGALALQDPDADDVDRALAQGCVGISVPAGALANCDAVARLQPILARLELLGAPLFVHPGPAIDTVAYPPAHPSLSDPLWWPAMTGYVAGMQAAWLAFVTSARLAHPELRVVFSMLAGLAPLQCGRLASRGGPSWALEDPLIFYDTSSYGTDAVQSVARAVGAGQLLYGSDRPVVQPQLPQDGGEFGWETLQDSSLRALRSTSAVP